MKHTPCRKISKGLLSGVCALFVLSGCTSADQQNTKEGVDLLFTGINHLLDAKSMQASGTLNLADESMPFSLGWVQDKNLQLAISAGKNPDDPQYAFYINDGKTYLDFEGTTSQSTLANLGLASDTKLSTLSPFLDMSEKERTECFSAVIQEDTDTWRYDLNRQKMSALFDSVGSIDFTTATITVTYAEDREISSLKAVFEGAINFSAQPLKFSSSLDLSIDALNSIDSLKLPKDLESYGLPS